MLFISDFFNKAVVTESLIILCMCSILCPADNIGEDIISHPENDKLCKLHFLAKMYCFVSVDYFIGMIGSIRIFFFLCKRKSDPRMKFLSIFKRLKLLN